MSLFSFQLRLGRLRKLLANPPRVMQGSFQKKRREEINTGVIETPRSTFYLLRFRDAVFFFLDLLEDEEVFLLAEEAGRFRAGCGIG